jgi:preprotein translocase subunit SecD
MNRTSIPIVILLITVVVVGFSCSKLRLQIPGTWQLTLQVENSTHDPEGAIKQTIAIIEKRLDADGIHGHYTVAREQAGSDRIIVKLPKVQDRERLKNLIVGGGKLELFHVLSLPSPIPLVSYQTKEEAAAFVKTLAAPEALRVLPYAERASVNNQKAPARWLIVRLPAIIDSTDLKTAEAVPALANEPDVYQIVFSLNKSAAQRFGVWTGAHVNEYLAVTLNDEVRSAAYIRSQISENGEINGAYTRQAAEDLALMLRSGPLPAPVKIVAEEDIK